jgi:hypothetical protein
MLPIFPTEAGAGAGATGRTWWLGPPGPPADVQGEAAPAALASGNVSCSRMAAPGGGCQGEGGSGVLEPPSRRRAWQLQTTHTVSERPGRVARGEEGVGYLRGLHAHRLHRRVGAGALGWLTDRLPPAAPGSRRTRRC